MNTIRVTTLLFLFLCATTALPPVLRAQSPDDANLLLGIAPALGMRWQQGTMRTSDGFHDCCSFTGGSGVGPAVSLRLLVPLGGALWLRGALGWERIVSDYSSERLRYPILGQGNTVEYVDLEDELSVTVPAIIIDAGVMYMLIEPGLFVAAGPSVTVPMSPSWTQTERINSPAGVQYADGGSQRTLFDVDMPGTRPFVSLRLGGGAVFPIAERVHLAPELMFSVPLMETQPDYRWSMSGLDLSVAVLLRL